MDRLSAELKKTAATSKSVRSRPVISPQRSIITWASLLTPPTSTTPAARVSSWRMDSRFRNWCEPVTRLEERNDHDRASCNLRLQAARRDYHAEPSRQTQ